jgi:flagellar P-ring protein precursor FlgI
MLLLTTLNGADGKVYAVAQGNVLTGGFAAGRGGNTQSVNHPTVGRIPSGAIVEQAPPSVAPGPKLKLQQHQSDFTTAAKVADALNQHFAAGAAPVAHALSSALVAVDLPEQWVGRPVEFVAEMENLTVEADHAERIVINEKTGTIVLGKDVKISPVAILHGALSVEVRTTLEVTQPGPLSSGTTAVMPQYCGDSYGGEGEEYRSRQRRYRGAIGAGPSSDWIDAARHHGDSRKYALSGCAGRGNRGDLDEQPADPDNGQ